MTELAAVFLTASEKGVAKFKALTTFVVGAFLCLKLNLPYKAVRCVVVLSYLHFILYTL